MSSPSSAADLLGVAPERWTSSALHAPDRTWIETNCYVDVWLELLPALGHTAEAALAFTLQQDFEGDQFTFFKFPPEDLQSLFGLSVQELAIYDTVERHTLEQLHRGRPVLIEVDSHWLADTVSYRQGHSKTTIAAMAIDTGARRLAYFHNTGYHALQGEDYEGLFGPPATPAVLFPYVEFVKRGTPCEPAALVRESTRLLEYRLERRPRGNPVSAWRAALPAHFERLAQGDMDFFHLYAFNLPRQLGANFELLATYLAWLDATRQQDAYRPAVEAGRRLAEQARAVQFQLARMARRKTFDPAKLDLGPLEEDYDTVFSTLLARTG